MGVSGVNHYLPGNLPVWRSAVLLQLKEAESESQKIDRIRSCTEKGIHRDTSLQQ